MLPAFCLFLTLFVRGYVISGDRSLFAPLFEVSLLSKIAQAQSFSFAELFFGGENGFDLFLAIAAALPFSIPAKAVFAALLRTGLLGLSFFVCAKALSCKNFSALFGSVLYSLCAYAFVSSLFAGACTLLLLLPLCVCALVWQAE
ncbi:MAG: hypothetical protein J6V82_01075, partial [Clostridia bacterium]|nr:hypothetical protein [Clostridia bacterium]